MSMGLGRGFPHEPEVAGLPAEQVGKHEGDRPRRQHLTFQYAVHHGERNANLTSDLAEAGVGALVEHVQRACQGSGGPLRPLGGARRRSSGVSRDSVRSVGPRHRLTRLQSAGPLDAAPTRPCRTLTCPGRHSDLGPRRSRSPLIGNHCRCQAVHVVSDPGRQVQDLTQWRLFEACRQQLFRAKHEFRRDQPVCELGKGHSALGVSLALGTAPAIVVAVVARAATITVMLDNGLTAEPAAEPVRYFSHHCIPLARARPRGVVEGSK
ncbi:protein of unknown function [Streptomyces murinus]